MKAGVGWYIWELMVTHSWGTVHGVFHPNGTVRDPTIVAALFGMFRNRAEDMMPAVPDREGFVTRAVANNKRWLADASARSVNALYTFDRDFMASWAARSRTIRHETAMLNCSASSRS